MDKGDVTRGSWVDRGDVRRRWVDRGYVMRGKWVDSGDVRRGS